MQVHKLTIIVSDAGGLGRLRLIDRIRQTQMPIGFGPLHVVRGESATAPRRGGGGDPTLEDMKKAFAAPPKPKAHKPKE